MVKRNFNGGGTTWPGSSSSGSSSSGSVTSGGGGGPHGNQSNQAANVINTQKQNKINQVIQAQQDERDWAGEFADVPSNVTYPKPADPYDWTKTDYGGVDPEYKAYLDNLERHTNEQGFSYYTSPGQSWFDRRDEQLKSAFGGYGGYDTPSGYLWDSLQGLSEDDKNRMWRLGEFPSPSSSSTYYGGGGGSGGYGYGYGYGGGGGGGGGGGYGYGSDDDPLARGYQRGKVGPGGLLEAVNQLYLRLSGMNKKRGGIIGLLRL